MSDSIPHATSVRLFKGPDRKKQCLEIKINLSDVAPGVIAGEHCFCGYGVADRAEFAKSVLKELKSEQEDGTTLVHEMLDKAIRSALENGEEGFTEEPAS